jgi:outer membrane murein-binding lipoprotein Lpp
VINKKILVIIAGVATLAGVCLITGCDNAKLDGAMDKTKVAHELAEDLRDLNSVVITVGGAVDAVIKKEDSNESNSSL